MTKLLVLSQSTNLCILGQLRVRSLGVPGSCVRNYFYKYCTQSPNCLPSSLPATVHSR
jgi:hypothetical protein